MTFYQEKNSCPTCTWEPTGLPNLCPSCDQLARSGERKVAETVLKREKGSAKPRNG